METSSTTLFPETTCVKPDPRKRLSLAVKELTRLIHHANQLAELADQPFPQNKIPESSAQNSTIQRRSTSQE